MKYLLLICFGGMALVGCASSQTAKEFRYISYEPEPTPVRSIGNIEGKDCSWSIVGYSLGEPSVRSAFNNAAAQKEDSLIPGQSVDKHAAPLKELRNVSVEHGGFSAWIVGRSCVTVTGEGYL